MNHTVDGLEEELMSIAASRTHKSRVINPDPKDVPSIDELNDLLKSGEITPSEFENYLYYFYPSIWLEDTVKSPLNPDENLKLWSFQIKILDDPFPQKALRFGRQLGKTASIVLKSIHIVAFNDNRRIVYYAPQQKHIDNLFGELDKFLGLCGDIVNLLNRKNITEEDIGDYRVALVSSTKRPQVRQFSNGSRIEGVILSQSPDQMGLSARGISATDVFFDEAAFIPDGAFSAALLTTRSFIRPTIWVSSTPTLFGLKFREMCQSSDFKEFHVSAEEADNWTPELEAFYKSRLTKEEYNLDILANWGETAEGVFKKTYIQRVPELSTFNIGGASRQYSYLDAGWLLEQGMFQYIVFGVDWNKPTNGTRIIVFGVTPDLQMYMLESIRIAPDLGQLFAIDEIVRLDNKYGNRAYIFVDEGFGEYPTEELHLIGVRDNTGLNERVIAIPTNATVETIDVFTEQKRSDPVNVVVTKTAVLYLERGWIHWPVEENLLEDISELTASKKSGIIPISNAMESYIIDRYTPNGRPIYKSTIGEDHSLTAFMYGVFGVNQNIRPIHLVDNILVKSHRPPDTIVIDKNPMALNQVQTVNLAAINKLKVQQSPGDNNFNHQSVPLHNNRFIYREKPGRIGRHGGRSLW